MSSFLVRANRNKCAHYLESVSLGDFLVGGAPVEVWYRGLRGFGRGYLPERCRATQSGRTPLHAASESGYGEHRNVVNKLLAAGADKNAKDGVRRGSRVEGPR